MDDNIRKNLPQEFLLPGEIIMNDSQVNSYFKSKNIQLRIGPGISHDYENKCLIANLSGYVCFKPPNSIWISARPLKYFPRVNDVVIGMVLKAGSEVHHIDIGHCRAAMLDVLAFEGVTKKNRPQLLEGDLVYARIEETFPDMEPKLTCVDKSGKSFGLGPLPADGNSFVCDIGIDLSLRLLEKGCEVINLLSKTSSFTFEFAVGMNGKLWVQSNLPYVANKMARFIKSLDGKNVDEIKKLIKVEFSN